MCGFRNRYEILGEVKNIAVLRRIEPQNPGRQASRYIKQAATTKSKRHLKALICDLSTSTVISDVLVHAAKA
jgi:hypothetical protein